MTERDVKIILSVMRKTQSKAGYVMLRGYEHRLIMSLHLNRPLKKSETVHHINENKSDNRIGNLELISGLSHTKLHNNLVKFVNSPENCKEKHPRWKREITEAVLIESFNRLRSLRQMEKELSLWRKSISDRLKYYGWKVVRRRAKKGYGWENGLKRYVQENEN